MQKLKPVMPSLREKKRYVAFEILSNAKLDVHAVAKAVWSAVLQFTGELGASKMGLIVLTDLYNRTKQKGIVRVAHTGLDAVRASFTFITTIDGHPVTVRSIAASGSITKAKDAIQ
jgi:ribonuclease P/MRP protein subunit POP5